MKRFFVLMMSFLAVGGCGGGGSTPRPPGPLTVYIALGDSVSASPNVNPNVVNSWPFMLGTKINATSVQDLAVNSATIERFSVKRYHRFLPRQRL